MSTSALHRFLIAGACALVVLPGVALAADSGTAKDGAAKPGAAGDAAPEQKLSVSPTSQDLIVSAGETTTVQLTVTAPASAIRVTYEHADYGLDEDYAPVLIPDSAEETTSFSTRGWFSTKQPETRIAAGKSAKLTFTITVPDNTPGGTYIGAMLLSITPDEADPDAQIQARAGVASVVFLNVDGGDPPTPRVDRFDVPKLVGGTSFTPKLVMSNRGSMTFAVDGVIQLDGKDIAENGRIATQRVVPDMPRDIRPQSNGKERLKIDTSKLSIGRHTITARLRIDPTNDTIVVNRTFWVIPMWVRILGGLGVLAVLLLLSWIAMRLRAWRARRSAGATTDTAQSVPVLATAASPATGARDHAEDDPAEAEDDLDDAEALAPATQPVGDEQQHEDAPTDELDDDDVADGFVDWADEDVAHEVEEYEAEDDEDLESEDDDEDSAFDDEYDEGSAADPDEFSDDDQA